MNNGRRTKLPPFEPSRCDESNGGGFVLLSPLDAEIIGKRQRIDYFIDVSPIFSASSSVRRTKLLSSEPSRYDESNDSSFVFPPSFFTEIIGKTSKNRPFYRRFADYLVIEGQNHYHSNHCIEMVRMAVVSSFYHYSLPK